MTGASRHVTAALLVVALAASLVGGNAEPVGAAVGPSLSVSGSPFDPDGDGVRETVRIRLELPTAAKVTLAVDDFDGRRKRLLADRLSLAAGSHGWTWAGRDENGRRVRPGPYKVKATVVTSNGTKHRARWVTRSRRVPYGIRPGAITVAIDPGHGGPADGAVWRGLREDAVNLDVAKRLEAMLLGAGVRVVMTRRGDRNVSPVGKDISGDRRYTRLDELIARNDVANQARADLRLALHNNASGCHCTRGTEMYTHFRRSWSPEGRALARFLLEAHLQHLRGIKGYRPLRRGVFSAPFKALKPYHPLKMRRPSLQASVLGESLFLDRRSEHRILKKRSGRTTIAAAYFDGIARYLAWRTYGVRYEVLQRPADAAAGDTASATVRITNTGHRRSAGWRLVARVVPHVPRYDGRPRRGEIVASVPIPDGLAPGASTVLTLPSIPMRKRVGTWLVKLDVKLPGGASISRHGVVGPQLKVRTLAP